MPKIAMIGAGSIALCKTLMMDIMATDALKESTFNLMSRIQKKNKKEGRSLGNTP